MFGDQFDHYQNKIEKLLTVYTLEDLLEMGDMGPAEALAHLYLEGLITLPDMKPVVFDA
jgi:hypothetical protein